MNCYFYSKVGACRWGDNCKRIHNKPNISQTIMFKHLYQNPPAVISLSEGGQVSDKELKEALKHFEQFYEEIFLELSNFGEIKDLSVVDNLADHLIGNVYVKFYDEASASKAYNSLAGKYYHTNLVMEEYSPIINIKDSTCKKYEEGLCQRGSLCNFLHLKEVNKSLLRSLKDEMYEVHPEYKKNRTMNNNKKKKRRHENSSSESSLDRYDNFTRKRIIQRWNDEAISKKKIEKRRKKYEKGKIELDYYEKKSKSKSSSKSGSKKDDEFSYERNYKSLKKFKEDLEPKKEKIENNEQQKYVDSDDEETISKGDLE